MVLIGALITSEEAFQKKKKKLIKQLRRSHARQADFKNVLYTAHHVYIRPLVGRYTHAHSTTADGLFGLRTNRRNIRRSVGSVCAEGGRDGTATTG